MQKSWNATSQNEDMSQQQGVILMWLEHQQVCGDIYCKFYITILNRRGTWEFTKLCSSAVVLYTTYDPFLSPTPPHAPVANPLQEKHVSESQLEKYKFVNWDDEIPNIWKKYILQTPNHSM